MKILEVKNLSKKYEKGILANKDLNLTLKKGESLGIIGPNGCGKTTLIRQVLRLLKPTSGEITVYDNGNKLDANERLDKIGYVPQYPLYFPSLTVEESLIYPLNILNFSKNKIEEKLNYIYKVTNLGKYKDNYTYTLSGGNLKLLLIMTAISQEKEILILDEPTAMVDINTKKIIWDILKSIKSEKAMIISSHDIQEIKENCDNTYFMSNGEFVKYIEANQFDEFEISHIAKFKITNQDELKEFEEILIKENLSFNLNESIFNIQYKDILELQGLFIKLATFKSLEVLDIQFPSFEKGVENLAKIYSK